MTEKLVLGASSAAKVTFSFFYFSLIFPCSMDLFESNIVNSDNSALAYHIFFIPGNPGLISYYSEFLHTLQSGLDVKPELGKKVLFHVLGTSLGGFEVDSSKMECDPGHLRTGPPYNLEEQICYVERKLRYHVDQAHRDLPGKNIRALRDNEQGSSSTKVVLVGHSVGAYILMEILRRHQERRATGSPDENFGIIGGVLLFPTVVDIAKSKSGIRLGVSSPFYIDMAST